MDYPILLPQTRTSITNPRGELHPWMRLGRLQLVAWKVSGRESATIFQRSLLSSCPQHGGKGLRRATVQDGNAGQAGVVNGVALLSYGVQGESLNDTMSYMQPCHDMEL